MSSGQSSPRENASPSSLEDDELVRNAKGGSERAYRYLVEKYERALFFHIKKMVKDQEIIEDLVQESFVKAFDSLNSYSPNYAFSTWLYRIATNHTIDYLRKKKLRTLSLDEPQKTGDGEIQIQLKDDSAGTDRIIIRKERQKIVRMTIENLPKKYHDVITLRHMEEKSYDEISEVLDLPLGTVKAHIYRARELLHKALKDKLGEF